MTRPLLRRGQVTIPGRPDFLVVPGQNRPLCDLNGCGRPGDPDLPLRSHHCMVTYFACSLAHWLRIERIVDGVA
jgi:hypothetical protein